MPPGLLLLTLRDRLKLSSVTSLPSAPVRYLDFEGKNHRWTPPLRECSSAYEKTDGRTVPFPDTCSDMIWGIRKDSIPRALLQAADNCLKPVTRGQNLSFRSKWSGCKCGEPGTGSRVHKIPLHGPEEAGDLWGAVPSLDSFFFAS